MGVLFTKTYHVKLNECVVGTATAETEGLYIQFHIECKPPDMQIYRLFLLYDSQKLDLGICVPENDHFCVHKRIQRKQLKGEEMEFILEPKNSKKQASFIPIDSNQPFEYFDCLYAARFEKRETVSGLVIQS